MCTATGTATATATAPNQEGGVRNRPQSSMFSRHVLSSSVDHRQTWQPALLPGWQAAPARWGAWALVSFPPAGLESFGLLWDSKLPSRRAGKRWCEKKGALPASFPRMGCLERYTGRKDCPSLKSPAGEGFKGQENVISNIKITVLHHREMPVVFPVL